MASPLSKVLRLSRALLLLFAAGVVVAAVTFLGHFQDPWLSILLLLQVLLYLSGGALAMQMARLAKAS